MPIKRYKAKSIQEAINRIKEDIGPDAMILSTRRLPQLRYGGDLFEVTAALHRPLPDPEPHIDEASTGGGGEPADPADNRCTGSDRPDPQAAERWRELNAELFSIKDMLFLMNQAGGLPEFLHRYPESLNLYAKLVKAGVSERQAQAIMKQGLGGDQSPRMAMAGITQRVMKVMSSMVSVSDPFATANGKQHLAAFIGPTGVGKTTTIAKLAAVLNLQQKKRVGIISVDSFRVGAVDQLRTYAAIMGLPCLSAFSARELQMAVRKMQEKDVVLIDTAGQSHLDTERMKALGRIMEAEQNISNHLVLSATTERSDMREAAENFSILHPRTYVFTKIDETRRRGAIIDQVGQLKMPISFVTNGQRVPEDILPADKRNILKLILHRA